MVRYRIGSPDPAHQQTYTLHRASSADLSGANADYRSVGPGATLTLLDTDCPGLVSHMWFTIASNELPGENGTPRCDAVEQKASRSVWLGGGASDGQPAKVPAQRPRHKDDEIDRNQNHGGDE